MHGDHGDTESRTQGCPESPARLPLVCTLPGRILSGQPSSIKLLACQEGLQRAALQRTPDATRLTALRVLCGPRQPCPWHHDEHVTGRPLPAATVPQAGPGGASLGPGLPSGQRQVGRPPCARACLEGDVYKERDREGRGQRDRHTTWSENVSQSGLDPAASPPPQPREPTCLSSC